MKEDLVSCGRLIFFLVWLFLHWLFGRKNPRSNSTFYTRPVRMMFSKETPELTMTQERKTLEEIERFEPLKFDGKQVFSNFIPPCLMKKYTTCNICGVTPNDTNAANVAKRPVNGANFKYGLAPLHWYIRFTECCGHISSRHSFEEWTIREADDKITSLEVSSSIIDEKALWLGLGQA